MIGETVSHYRILSELGAGGIGVVYEAEDLNLGRKVALKFLVQAPDSPQARERFRREARAASALNHPHICVVYDLGEHEGTPFIAMERLQGRTLKQLLAGGPLPCAQVLDLGSQLADALVAAHAAGIVHRDVKPANVFVTEHGVAKLLDFGLAKSVGEPSAGAELETAAHLTLAGSLLGTVAYMSPEQARGQTLDARSDVFSLGVVLYEMATGRLPFEGQSLAETLKGILADTPTSPANLNSAVPLELERTILKALEKDRALRYQHAAELRADLKGLSRDSEAGRAPMAGRRPWSWTLGSARRIVALAVVAALALAAGLWRAGPGREVPTAPTGVKRMAVLPFENLGEAEDAYFADGMTDEVRGRLAGLSGLAVIASGSASQYKGTTKPPEQIANELGVGFLLVAKVRWQKTGGVSRIRLTSELVEVAGGSAPTARWQEAFEADLSDVFRVQGEIAIKVAQSLELALSGMERGVLTARPTANLAAYDAYLQGREIEKGGDQAARRRGAQQYEQAVALDPAFALGWARLAIVRSEILRFGVPSPQEVEGARQAAEQALRLAPGLAEGHVALGDYYFWVRGEYDRAIEAYRHGLSLTRDDAPLLRGLARAERARGQWEEALVHLRRARELDPRSWEGERQLGYYLLLLRRTGEAREAIDRGLVLAPTNLTLISDKAMTFLQQGDLPGARAVLAAALKDVPPAALVAKIAVGDDLHWVLDAPQRDVLLRLSPGAFDGDRATWGLVLAQAWALRGDQGKAREYAEVARQAFAAQLAEARNAQPNIYLALALAYLGRKDEAIREGERSAALFSIERQTVADPYVRLQLARIHILLGNHDRALDLLEALLKEPYHLTPGWLRIDPNFDPLRGHPRFNAIEQGR